ncbi:MAG TPA: mechanosensitive ion channel [Saprospiraceae bacterium]|nr:mechanosensitive ion channel [Saprospiraceae bacterium]HNM25157.1 mechanosensitive ion channel [Saprospiraceae bacterium]
MNSLLLFQSPIPTDGPLAQLFAQFSAAFPKMVAALSVLLVGWLISKLLRRVLRGVLERIGIDRLAERLNDIDIVQRSGMTIRPSGMISSAVYYVLMLFFVIAATDLLGVAAITQLVTDVINYLPSLFTAAIVFLLGIFVADMVRSIALTALKSLGIPSASMIASAVFYFLFITVSVSALAQARVNTDFIANNLTMIIAAAAGAFALGYGLAARHLVANYLASHYNRDKVRVGYDVTIDGVRGKVVLIDSTSMILQTNDRAIIIPLSKLTTEKVEVHYPEGQEDNLLNSGQ